MVNHRFVSWVLLFHDVLTFWSAIALCYNQQSMVLKSCVPSLRIWDVYEVVAKVLSPIIIGCVLNRCCKFTLVVFKCLTFYNISLLENSRRDGMNQLVLDNIVREDFSIMSWKNLWFTWGNRFWKFFYFFFPSCMHLIRSDAIICLL